MTRYNFARSNKGTASREIPKLIINSPQGQPLLDGEQVPQYMAEKYAKIIQVDNEAGTLSIEEFLGPQLYAMLRKCPQGEIQQLTALVDQQEIDLILKDIIGPFITQLLVQYGNDFFFSDHPLEIAGWFYHRTILFILKAGKCATDPDRYRGLSMLENIFKIFGKILANRLKRPLKYIQHWHQFGLLTINAPCKRHVLFLM